MRTKTQLELLRKLRQRKGLAKGFTLIELLVVIAIIGILAGTALPAFLGARASAAAGAKIGEVVGLAKECSVYITSGGIGTAPTSTYATCSPSAAADFVATWNGTVGGLTCLTASSTTGASTATITVSSTGTMSCSFG